MPTDVVAAVLRPSSDTRELARQLARIPELEETRKLVRRDPAIAVATLRHAYKTQREQTKQMTDLDQLITRLGTHAMQDVMKQVGKLEPLDRASSRALSIRDHSVRVAVIAGDLSVELGRSDLERVKLVGLLHDVGKLLAIQAGDTSYLDVPPRFDQPDLLNVYERRTLGYDHAKLGWHALSVWGLPDPIPSVIAWHHQGSRAYSLGGETATLVAVLRAADALEKIVASGRDLDDDDLWKLDRNLACRKLGLAPDMLRRKWPTLQKICAEALPIAPPAVAPRRFVR